MNVLVIDVGGTNLKISVTGSDEVRKTPSGPELTPEKMVADTKKLAKGWNYDVVSIGYPGAVVDNKPVKDPANLAPGWVNFDFEKAFGRPVKVINDAAMQALGSYDGGRMLFLGLGTGLGSAMVIQRIVMPMELAHLPYKKGRTYEQWVGKRAYEKFPRKKWEKVVGEVVDTLKFALQADYVVLGGGNAKKIKKVPKGARLGANENAFVGGFRMWEENGARRRK
jgi:predicted NBD/HSP70 family sugar kinase